MSNSLLKIICVPVADGLFKNEQYVIFSEIGVGEHYLLVRKLSSLPSVVLD